MKLLPLLPFVATGLIAQAQHPEVRIPRDPSIGVAKSLAPLPIKDGIPTATDLVVPAERPARPAPVDAAARLDAVKSVIAAQFADPDFVAFDMTPDGTVWAAADSYKAAFEAASWRFIGRPADSAPDVQPIEFRLQKVQVGERSLPLGEPRRQRDARHVSYDHGSVVEAIDIGGGGVEQTFTFATLPQRGELVLEMAVRTALVATGDADGIAFRGPFDHVRYSAAVAIDADGARIAAPTSLVDGRLTIRVPAAFVATAALPLRIDPLLTSVQAYSSTTDVGDPDIAWDETGQVWAVCFMRYFGGFDWDTYVQRVSFGSPMTLVGSLTTIDASGVSWQRPRIASLAVYSEFMVVCQTYDGTNPWRVQGRIMGNSGVLVTGQFVIASSTVDELHPDIGGDANGAPAYFTVVWEHAYSGTDHDIYGRQVDATGALRGTSPIYVQTNTANQSWPSISKSSGGDPLATKRFAIVYQQTFSASDNDVYGALLTWDGTFVLAGAGTTFTIEANGYNATFPQVSSPTLPNGNGDRLILATYERSNYENGNIVATCFDQAGSVRASADVTDLEPQLVRRAWPQYRPTVDSDGFRFAIAYHEVFNGNTTVNDLDTRMTVVAFAGNGTLVAEEAGVALGLSGNREFNAGIASRYSGTGAYSPHVNTCNDRDGITGGGFAIDAYSFTVAPQGSFTVRATACGSLGILYGGQAIPGGTVTLSLTSSPYIEGFVLGTATSQPIGPCPGCTLGVNGFLLVGSSCSIPVPFSAAIVGYQFAGQGFLFQPTGAPCLDQIQLSDTVDVTIG